MANDTKAIELLFQRPLEPVFTSRDNGKTAFDLPDSYYTGRYAGANVALENRFGDSVQTKASGCEHIIKGAENVTSNIIKHCRQKELFEKYKIVKIPLRELQNKPNLDFASKLGMKKQFSLFNRKHMEIAGKIIQLFLDSPNLQGFSSLAAYVKDRVNPFLFQYCFSVAVSHREDTRTVQIPPVAETFPANFVEPSVLKEARAEGSLITDPGERVHVQILPNYTASDREMEQRLFYFREDIGVNMHHWHWHLVYPQTGPDAVVNKDRRGELFYYMHHQLMARYNAERFCNDLSRTKPLNNLREPIPEGYFPKLLSSVNNRTYPARITNQTLRDVAREDNTIEIAEVERWRDRIFAAIDQGYVEDPRGNRIPLDEVRGIDILGNILESSQLNINPQFYGNLHNMGHNLISYAHDPDNRHLEDFGVMGDVTTAMRDPIFYRWHTFIDNICNKYKAILPPYNETHLSFNGITVDYVEAKISSKNANPNTLLTYWQKSDVDLAAGLDFGPNGNIYASFTHLQNAPFDYLVNVTNNSGGMKKGTCRIFICPKADERGTPLKIEDQRLLAIEMDKFTVNLNPGANTIRRRSADSSVTIPFERSFRRVGPVYQPKGADDLASFRFCGCGWPQHLLLPKGKAEGMPFDLFVMISDYTGDAVQQTSNKPDVCADASSFCGLKDKLYPDKRTMGFPFDRRLPAADLNALTNTFKNMRKVDITVVFNNRVVEKV